MTAEEKYTPDQIRGAFAWLADWECRSGVEQYDEEDQSESACRVLGQRAYDVVCLAAQSFQRRNGAS